jgi:hypothetical protein
VPCWKSLSLRNVRLVSQDIVHRPSSLPGGEISLKLASVMLPIAVRTIQVRRCINPPMLTVGVRVDCSGSPMALWKKRLNDAKSGRPFFSSFRNYRMPRSVT